MSSFKEGDRVYVTDDGDLGNYCGNGTVTRVLPNGWVRVKGDERFSGLDEEFEFDEDRLTLISDEETERESQELQDIRDAVAEYHRALEAESAVKDVFTAALAATPARHPNSARFHELLEEAASLHDKKQADYGSAVDPFANVRASSDWGIAAWIGTMVRLNDKVKRLQSLAQKGELVNEAAVDSFMDIAVYALIARVLYEEQAAA